MTSTSVVPNAFTAQPTLSNNEGFTLLSPHTCGLCYIIYLPMDKCLCMISFEYISINQSVVKYNGWSNQRSPECPCNLVYRTEEDTQRMLDLNAGSITRNQHPRFSSVPFHQVLTESSSLDRPLLQQFQAQLLKQRQLINLFDLYLDKTALAIGRSAAGTLAVCF